MKKYLENLITEKGKSLDDALDITGHYGLCYQDLVDFIVQRSPATQNQIRKTLVMIDFKNGNVFHYFNHLACGMIHAVTGLAVVE